MIEYEREVLTNLHAIVDRATEPHRLSAEHKLVDLPFSVIASNLEVRERRRVGFELTAEVSIAFTVIINSNGVTYSARAAVNDVLIMGERLSAGSTMVWRVL